MDGLDRFPPPLPPDAGREHQRRIRGRNIALLMVLIATVALFYAIAVVKFKVH